MINLIKCNEINENADIVIEYLDINGTWCDSAFTSWQELINQREEEILTPPYNNSGIRIFATKEGLIYLYRVKK